MEWFNLYGLVFMGILLIPNLIFALRCKEGFETLWKNPVVEALEQIGRFGCMGLMVFHIPGTCFGFPTAGALRLYLAVNTVLVAVYCVIWAVCFKKNSLFRALSLSVLPSVIFLFSGAVSRSVLLLVAAGIFAPCHIWISYKNAALAKTGESRTRDPKV